MKASLVDIARSWPPCTKSDDAVSGRDGAGMSSDTADSVSLVVAIIEDGFLDQDLCNP